MGPWLLCKVTENMASRELEFAKSKVTAEEAVSVESPTREVLGELLSFIYPVHYCLGMDLETVMCQGQVSRKQAAILWLVHYQADDSGWIRRKEIEERLSTWFEISNSNISILLRELTKPPMALLTQTENPANGREKVASLTKKGEKFVSSMVEASVDYLGQMFSHLSEKDAKQGVYFFKLLFL